MNFELPARHRVESAPSLRAFAIGDSVFAPPLYRLRTATASIVSYQPASIPAMLRRLLPGLVLEDADIAGRDAVNTAGLAAGIEAIVAAHAGYDLALVSVGLNDCEETTRGVAPEPAATVAALERIVGCLLHAAIRPVLLLPPPHPLFANGLFADRFVCVSATLRRLARQFPEMILVDPTDAMKHPDGFGIDPRPEMVDAGQAGKPSVAAACLLAEMIADRLLAAFPAGLLDRAPEAGAIALLPADATERLDGSTAHFRLDDTHAGGIAADASMPFPGTTRIQARGAYTSQWPFLRLHNLLPPALVESLPAGSSIAAAADIRIGERPQGLASVSLQLTPVWASDYVGLSSCEFHGQTQIGNGRIRLLRTPRFRLPAPLKELNVSLMMHFEPAAEGSADATVDVMSIDLACSPAIP